MLPGPWITTLVLGHLTWISLLSRHRQDNFYLLYIVQVTPHQCKIYVMGNVISHFRSYYLVPRFFFRSWHRCTEREGFIIKISHSGCTILYQVSNINFTELRGSYTTILTTDNVKGMQAIYLKNQKTPCPKRPYNYMIHLIKVNNHYSMTKLWTTLVVGGVSDIVYMNTCMM